MSWARNWARTWLGEWELDELAEDVQLIVSELVTNALRHGDSEIFLMLDYDGFELRCEVDDGGLAQPHRVRATPEDIAGRGLELVEYFVGERGGAWGFLEHERGPGKAVFVVLPTRQRP